ncbi:hypothetical protein D3C86_2121330 [compost metagenome]
MLYQNDDTPSIMNGAFHPDFRVHATIADYIYESVSMAWRAKEGRDSVNLKQSSAGL